MTKTTITERTEIVTTNTLSGKIDAKGRAMGTRVRTNEVTLTELSENDAKTMSYYRLEPGHYYTAQIQATKNGEKWGSWQPTQYFKTEAERDAAVAKRLAKAAK